MNLTRIIDIKERIATCDAFKPDERDFILDCINLAVATTMADAKPDQVDAPPNYLGRIDTIWAALSVDEGGEGVCVSMMGGLGWVPLIAADRRRLDQIKPMARGVATASGKPVRIAKFTKREDMEIFQP